MSLSWPGATVCDCRLLPDNKNGPSPVVDSPCFGPGGMKTVLLLPKMQLEGLGWFHLVSLMLAGPGQPVCDGSLLPDNQNGPSLVGLP